MASNNECNTAGEDVVRLLEEATLPRRLAWPETACLASDSAYYDETTMGRD
jgi:hypothetical protein